MDARRKGLKRGQGEIRWGLGGSGRASLDPGRSWAARLEENCGSSVDKGPEFDHQNLPTEYWAWWCVPEGRDQRIPGVGRWASLICQPQAQVKRPCFKQNKTFKADGSWGMNLQMNFSPPDVSAHSCAYMHTDLCPRMNRCPCMKMEFLYHKAYPFKETTEYKWCVNITTIQI